ncbi:MAG: hypothetical protein QS721_07180 [Candidatus Endonucleobacter sp. (ex Gigantidas childressi)]|nr:hypothetical protein [Candidatus Endonucleobacter sp. (ex Gigantidas childressi)]
MKKSDPFITMYMSYFLAIASIHALGDLLDPLPILGDSKSSIISQQQEQELWHTYLKAIQHRTPTINDAELKDHYERLASLLSAPSEIKDHRLVALLSNETTINAFTTLGGITDINVGLFINAETAAPFATAIPHEFAHSSQQYLTIVRTSNTRG